MCDTKSKSREEEAEEFLTHKISNYRKIKVYTLEYIQK